MKDEGGRMNEKSVILLGVHPSSLILHPCFWRGARVVELAALEML
jgi:hypothetical protein